MLIPNGNNEVFAIVKCFIPNGIPTIVMQNINPQTICTNAISHQPSNIQIILPTKERQPGSPGAKFISLPKGQNAYVPIFINCTPNGIPIIVMQKTSPDIQYIRAVNNPPKISQIILPKKFITGLSDYFCEFRHTAIFIADKDVNL